MAKARGLKIKIQLPEGNRSELVRGSNGRLD